MSALLEVRDLFKTYGTGEAATRVLRGLSLCLEAGEMAALLGPSGSGKSTLLTILGTLMKPTSGSYVMLGQDMVAADDKALTDFRNAHIGFVFQFHNLLPDFTALENVIFPTAVREGRETPPPVRVAANCCPAWGWPTGSISLQPTFPAGKNSGSLLHAP
jgi:lipoprotein-releasing system ATP-binding protein